MYGLRQKQYMSAPIAEQTLPSGSVNVPIAANGTPMWKKSLQPKNLLQKRIIPG